MSRPRFEALARSETHEGVLTLWRRHEPGGDFADGPAAALDGA